MPDHGMISGASLYTLFFNKLLYNNKKDKGNVWRNLNW